MDYKQHKIALTASLVLGALLLGGIVAYGTGSRDPFSATIKRIYPAIVVGGRIVSVEESDTAFAIAKSLNPKATFGQSQNQFIKNIQYEVVAKKQGFRPSSDAIPDELLFLTKGKGEELRALLQNYFYGKERLFEKYVVYPSVYESAARIEYNSDFSINKDAYGKASSLLNRIKAGEKLEDLARIYSDDEYTGQIGGDLGFFEHGQILPELEKAIAISSLGEVPDRVVVSRLGYHIIYPVETSIQDGIKHWHAKHILIKTDGFEKWFENEARDIRVWKIVK